MWGNDITLPHNHLIHLFLFPLHTILCLCRMLLHLPCMPSMEFSIPIAFNLKSTVSIDMSSHIILYNTSFMFFFNGIEISGYVFHCSGNTFMPKKSANISNVHTSIKGSGGCCVSKYMRCYMNIHIRCSRHNIFNNIFNATSFSNINNSFLNISHIIYCPHLFFNNFNLCIYYTYKVNICQLCVIKNNEKLILSS